jgi:hypothetical protein
MNMKITTTIPIIIAICLNLSCESDDNAVIQKHENVDLRLTSILQNSMKYLEFTYDSLNRLIQSDLYFDGTTYTRTAYFYDLENRLTGKSYDGYYETYEYDSNGSLKSLTKLYPETEKVWKRIFIHENGRIKRAEIYYDETQTDYAVYEYDEKGNTREIREYPVNNENSGLIMVHRKFSYDDAVNPLSLIGYTPVDIKQTNNPVYVYYGNALMCRGPVEYDATYDYNEFGLPVNEHRSNKGYPGTDVFTYVYQSVVK